MIQEVGSLSARVIELLGLPLADNQPIYLGDSNVTHMQARHPADFEKYGCFISEILAHPDYVKEFVIDGEYVKVAVRLSGGGKLYARSIYVLNQNRVENFIAKGTLKKI